MGRGSLTISIDLELAWGNWDNLSSHHILNVQTLERKINLSMV